MQIIVELKNKFTGKFALMLLIRVNNHHLHKDLIQTVSLNLN